MKRKTSQLECNARFQLLKAVINGRVVVMAFVRRCGPYRAGARRAGSVLQQYKKRWNAPGVWVDSHLQCEAGPVIDTYYHQRSNAAEASHHISLRRVGSPDRLPRELLMSVVTIFAVSSPRLRSIKGKTKWQAVARRELAFRC